MIDEREIVRRAVEALTPPEPSFDRLLQRRDRVHRNRRIRAGALGMAVAIAVGWLGVNAIRSTPPVSADRSEELGIFAPVAGRILFVNEDGVAVAGFDPGPWAIDPSGPADTTAGPRVADEVVSTLVPLGPEDAIPLDWSGDGTELLFERMHGDLIVQEDLYLLHSDGSETLLVRGYGGSATIAPDGTRVVFSGACGQPGLCVVDAGGGQPAPLPFPSDKDAYSPTFSPDGTRIAYLVDQDDDLTHVWVADVNGSAAPREILAPEETRSVGAGSLQWSPAGDRLAFGVRGFEGNGDVSSIYTFAPDGSDFTRVITHGEVPYWSPDGSQIAYTINCTEASPDPSCGDAGIVLQLAIADADGSNVRAFGFAASGPWHPAGASQLRVAPPNVPATDPPTRTTVASGALAYALDGDIYVADPDGSNAVRIFGDLPDGCKGDGWNPSWSPDGRYLAFWRECQSSAQADVVITDPLGNAVTEFPKGLWGFTWSPDSTRIAVWEASSQSTIGVYGLDGVRQALLPMPPTTGGGNDSAPAWMPDGSALLVYGYVVVPLDGSAGYELSLGGQAVYSPDGTRVAVVAERSTVITDVDGSPVSEVDMRVDPEAWSPDGDRFASSDRGELSVVDVASGTVTVLNEAEAALPPGRVILGIQGFSPQGDRILYQTGDGAGGSMALYDIGVDGSDARLLVAGTTQGQWRSR